MEKDTNAIDHMRLIEALKDKELTSGTRLDANEIIKVIRKHKNENENDANYLDGEIKRLTEIRARLK